MNFAQDIEDFVKKSEGEILRVKRATALKLFSAIIKDTPVGNPDLWQSLWKDSDGRAIDPPEGYVGGRLRANWMVSLNGFDDDTTESTDKEGAVKLLMSKVVICQLNDEICMSNSLPYAYRIEYDGHSKQAPAGMVRRNVIRFKRIVSDQLKKKGFY